MHQTHLGNSNKVNNLSPENKNHILRFYVNGLLAEIFDYGNGLIWQLFDTSFYLFVLLLGYLD